MTSTLYITGCAAVFDTLADIIFANEVRSDDRESPLVSFTGN